MVFRTAPRSFQKFLQGMKNPILSALERINVRVGRTEPPYSTLFRNAGAHNRDSGFRRCTTAFARRKRFWVFHKVRASAISDSDSP
eukprot:2648757-Prorocentrum_lima.AAC.1